MLLYYHSLKDQRAAGFLLVPANAVIQKKRLPKVCRCIVSVFFARYTAWRRVCDLQRPHVLEIITPARTLVLAAREEAAMKAWVRV